MRSSGTFNAPGMRSLATSKRRRARKRTSQRSGSGSPSSIGVGPTFVIESRVTRSRGRDRFVVSEFFQDETIAVHALTQWKVL